MNLNELGTKIYYCELTGNIIKIIGDSVGAVKETSIDEDHEIYSELKEREKDTIGLIKYEYGVYEKLSKNSTGCYFDLVKEEVVFIYEDLNQPEEPTREIDILSKKIEIIESENADLLFDSMMKDTKIDQLEKDLADLTFEVIMGGI